MTPCLKASTVPWGGILQYCCAPPPSFPFRLKDFFPKLLGMLLNDESQPSALFGHYFCCRELPCSCLRPLLRVDHSQWFIGAWVWWLSPLTTTQASLTSLSIFTVPASHLRHYCGCTTTQLLPSSQSCFILCPSQMVTPRAFLNKLLPC